MKTATTRCGACSTPPGPGTRPGLMVVKRNAPRPTVWLALAYRLMSALHRRGIAAAQHDVEAVGERPLRNGVGPVEHRDQANARFLLGDRVVHRVVLEQRVSRKIHLRDQPREERG